MQHLNISSEELVTVRAAAVARSPSPGVRSPTEKRPGHWGCKIVMVATALMGNGAKPRVKMFHLRDTSSSPLCYVLEAATGTNRREGDTRRGLVS